MLERAVTYVRVSTEEERQLNALENQRREAKQAIKEKGWEFVKEYVDEGKSGTQTRTRNAYNQLFQDLATNKFDIIVIKDQDRLMRNPKDWYLFLAEMQQNGKQLYMYMEDYFYKSEDSLITGIKAILAAEYSRNLSKKLNLANKNRQKEGRSIITHGRMLGYIQHDGELYIHEEEAKVVRRIAELYEQNMGARAIKKVIDAEGWVNRFGNPISVNTIKRLPHNYAYEGTIIQNRLHKDFDTKKVSWNDPSEWYIHENRCPVIIPHERMEKIRALMRKRTNGEAAVPRGSNRGTYPLSSKIVCSECGSHYRRVFYGKNGNLDPYWICGTYQELGRKHPKGRAPKETGCDGRNIRESTIYDALHRVADEYAMDMALYAKQIIDGLRKIHSQSDHQKEISALSQKLANIQNTQSLLLDKLLDGTINETAYARKNNELEEKKQAVQNDIDEVRKAKDSESSFEERYAKLTDIITSPKVESESKFRFILDCVENITICPDHMDIILKAGDDGDSVCVRCSTAQDTYRYVRIKLNLSERYDMPYEARIYLR